VPERCAHAIQIALGFIDFGDEIGDKPTREMNRPVAGKNQLQSGKSAAASFYRLSRALGKSDSDVVQLRFAAAIIWSM
jgi:hypothetical protein